MTDPFPVDLSVVLARHRREIEGCVAMRCMRWLFDFELENHKVPESGRGLALPRKVETQPDFSCTFLHSAANLHTQPNAIVSLFLSIDYACRILQHHTEHSAGFATTVLSLQAAKLRSIRSAPITYPVKKLQVPTLFCLTEKVPPDLKSTHQPLDSLARPRLNCSLSTFPHTHTRRIAIGYHSH